MPFVQVGTYPTRNFATLGPFSLLLAAPLASRAGLDRFRRALHVAMQVGLSHLHLRTPPFLEASLVSLSEGLGCGVWRIVSEDSRVSSPGLSC